MRTDLYCSILWFTSIFCLLLHSFAIRLPYIMLLFWFRTHNSFDLLSCLASHLTWKMKIWWPMIQSARTPIIAVITASKQTRKKNRRERNMLRCNAINVSVLYCNRFGFDSTKSKFDRIVSVVFFLLINVTIDAAVFAIQWQIPFVVINILYVCVCMSV